MPIWYTREVPLEQLNLRLKGTIGEFLGIKFTEVGENYLKAELAISQKVLQPLWLVHGGVHTVLAETVATYASNLCIDRSRYYAIGVQTHTYLLKPVDSRKADKIISIARPLNLGKKLHFWNVEHFAKTHNEANELVATIQVITIVRSNDELSRRRRTYELTPSSIHDSQSGPVET